MINIFFSSFKRKKNYLILLALLILCYLLFGIFLFLYYKNENSIDLIKNDKINRGIEIICSEEDINSILSNHSAIEYFFPIYNNQVLKINNTNYSVNYFNNYEDDIISGEKISNSKEIILSSKIKEDIVNINVGKNKYKVVGVINNPKASLYFDKNEFEEMFNVKPTKYYALIKDYEYIPSVINYLASKNIVAYNYDVSLSTEIESLQKVQNLYISSMIIIILLLMLFFAIIIKNLLNIEKKNIALLKLIGYSNKKISLIVFARILFVIICSILLSQLIFTLFYFGFNNYFKLEISILLKVNFIITTLFLLVGSVFSLLSQNKIKKIKPILELQNA